MEHSNFQRYFWTTIWLCTGTFLGIAFVTWFSVAGHVSAGALLLWAMAYFATGGLVGFIFCVPKLITDTTTAALPTQPQGGGGVVPAQQPPANNAGPAAQAPISIAAKTKAQENTNLTQISDWLTKILIGAGLVQIKEAPGFIHHIAYVMGSGLAEKGQVPMVTMMCAAIILYFLTWGFISGYLVMKLILTEQFINSSDDH